MEDIEGELGGCDFQNWIWVGKFLESVKCWNHAGGYVASIASRKAWSSGSE